MIQISKTQLVEAMRGFRLLKIQNNALPVLGNVLVSQRHGAASLHVTNLDENLTYRFACDDTGDAQFLVPYEQLRDAELHADAKSVVELEEQLIRISAGGVSMELLIDPIHVVTDFPTAPELKGEGVVFDPTTLSAIQDATSYVSSDKARPVMHGVHISRKNITATDGKRLYTCNSRDLNVPTEGYLLPVKSALKLFDLTADARFHYGKLDDSGRNFMALEQDKWVYFVTAMEGTFPNWQQLFNDLTGKAYLELSDVDVKRLQKLLPALPDKDLADAPVILRLDREKPLVQAGTQNVELDHSEWYGQSIAIQLNRHYLLEALGMGMRKFRLTSDMKACLVEDDTGMRKVLIMPQRLNADVRVQSYTREKPAVAVPNDRYAPEATPVCIEVQKPSVANPVVSEEVPADEWIEVAQQLAQTKDSLRLLMQSIANIQNLFKTVKARHKLLEREAKHLQRGIRSLQRFEIPEEVV